MLHGQIAKAIASASKRGLGYIAAQQLPGGGFHSLSSTDPANFRRAQQYRTTFVPSLILGALAGNNETNAQIIKQQIASFLLAQKSADWSFNYWDRKSLQARALPYPDDLDDTFAALSALAAHKPALFSGEVIAHVATMLLHCEAETGGPYRTWIVADNAPEQWKDIDIAVNAQIGRFLAQQEVRLPALTQLAEEAIAHKKLSSPYYPGPYAMGYFLSFWYRGEKISELWNLLVEQYRTEPAQSAVTDALLLSTGKRLGVADPLLAVLSQRLLDAQASNGSWPVKAFCIDPHQGGRTAYAGSAALSTALAIEALTLGTEEQEEAAVTMAAKPGTEYQRVVRDVRRQIRDLPGAELRKAAAAVLERLLAQDADGQIVLLPTAVAKAVHAAVDSQIILRLARASLWGWMAYTIFDDFLDGDGQTMQLPAAIMCERKLLGELANVLPDQASFHIEVASILDRIDAANTWEAVQSRAEVTGSTVRVTKLPDYGAYTQLADRSLGHLIAALGVCYGAGYGAESREIQSLREFFSRYLIARQLNDDMHDWEEDLRRGQLNAVGAQILAVWQKKHAVKTIAVDVEAEQQVLRLIMWETVAPKMCKEILRQVTKARKAIAGVPDFDASILDPLVAKAERAALQALAERADTLAFIKGLASNSTKSR